MQKNSPARMYSKSTRDSTSVVRVPRSRSLNGLMEGRSDRISSSIVDKAWKQAIQITNRNVILVKEEVVFEGSSDELLTKLEMLEQYLGV
jgi:hypothetical protein